MYTTRMPSTLIVVVLLSLLFAGFQKDEQRPKEGTDWNFEEQVWYWLGQKLIPRFFFSLSFFMCTPSF